MLAHSDWKFRHAALMAISATGEGCHKQMESYLSQIMDGVMNFINDSVVLIFREQISRKINEKISFLLAPSCSICLLQCNWTNVYRFCARFPKEVSRESHTRTFTPHG